MKTKKIRIKQGFTIVELVIVIGVIGVLAAVLIPTFINLNNKAQEAENQSFVKNLNTQMAIRETEEGKNKTMYDAIKDAKEIGFDVEKLTPVNGRDLVWDSVANRFALLNEDGSAFYSDGGLKGTGEQIWKIYDAIPATQTYSIYAKSGWGDKDVVVTVGFDAGSNVMTSVKYTGTKDVTIRTNGDQCKFTVDAPNANVDYYGFAKTIEVTAVKGESLHIYGTTNELKVTAGHVAIEDTGIVFDLSANTGSVTNNGYVAKQTGGTAATGAAVGGDYGIGNLDRLEAFRDAVNSGNSFAGVKIKLTADIKLRNGWTPIGEGSRKIAKVHGVDEGNFFQGEFDGAGKTISNLNNKGFVPSDKRIVKDGDVYSYAYGLFGLVGDGASITGVKLKDVDIDTTRYEGQFKGLNVIGDSVGSLVGYSAGSVTVNGNSVLNGSVKGHECTGGVVGRAYNNDAKTGSATFNSNSNAASVTSVGIKAAGIAGYINLPFTANYNANTGTIAAKNNNIAAIAITGTKATQATGNTHNGNPAADESANTGTEGVIGRIA